MQWEENSLKLNMNLAAYLVHDTYIIIILSGQKPS